MVNERKHQRQVAAAKAALQRAIKRVYSLSVALMRADAASHAAVEGWTGIQATGKSDDQLLAPLADELTRLENSAATVTGALVALHLACLYAVVEKWQEWKFADAEVDRLLSCEHLLALKKYRHAIFHVEEFDAEDILIPSADSEFILWARQLADALRQALRDWHKNTESRASEYLMRAGY